MAYNHFGLNRVITPIYCEYVTDIELLVMSADMRVFVAIDASMTMAVIVVIAVISS